jgi:hypothetical protein
MKQTAAEWLQQALEDTILDHEQIMQTIGLFEQAKEMEKAQIMDAYDAGQLHFWPDEFLQRGEYYYNETFNTNEK